jgi:hypothetical protein
MSWSRTDDAGVPARGGLILPRGAGLATSSRGPGRGGRCGRVGAPSCLARPAANRRKLCSMLKGFSVLAFLVAGLMLPPSAHADCVTQITGEVICGTGPCNTDMKGQASCAQYRFGTAVRTSCGDAAKFEGDFRVRPPTSRCYGQVVCGRGRCVTTFRGEIVCSVLDGGGAVIQIDGTVRCDGACEAASPDLCERRPAGR